MRNKTELERDLLNIFRAKSVLEKILETLKKTHFFVQIYGIVGVNNRNFTK